MNRKTSRSMDLGAALRVLLNSESFRYITRILRIRVTLTALALVCATLAGLYAIDSQSQLMGFQEHSRNGNVGRFYILFVSFVGAQLLFEVLQWFRRSLQNQVSVFATDELRRRIYAKYCEFRYCELQTLSSGEVAQLHSSDASLLASVWADGILSFLTTLMLTLGVSIFLTVQIGVAGSLFFVVLIILIFLAQRFSRQMSPTMQKRAIYSAQRLSVIQESVRSVSLVKALTAEKEFAKRVDSFLNLEQEMKLLTNQISCRYVPVFASLRWFAWAGVLVWIIYSPLVTGVELEPSTLVALVFAVNWFSSLLQDSFLFVGTYLSSIQVGAVSAQRIDSFLGLPVSQPVFFPPPANPSGEALLGVEHVSVEYPTRRGQWALNDVSLTALRGQLVVIIGPVGSGKSTLLRTLLGELIHTRGRVLRSSGLKVAYLPQDVVLPSATLRDAMRYQFENALSEDDLLSELLRRAEFGPDLETLNSGLGTAIGERGVTLSGGQRLRVGLSQLAYFKEADVILLDDPVAALDAQTSERINSSLICGLWAGRTRILTTHRLDLARSADWVVRMEGGRVVEQGPPEQLGVHRSHY